MEPGRGFVAGLLAAGGAACTLLVDTGDLRSGPEPVVVDGGTEAAIAAGGDEAGSADAADGATASGCAAHPGLHLCRDFDDVNDVAEGWSDLRADGKGTVTLDMAAAFSPPRSAKLNLVGAPTCSYVRLEHQLGETNAREIELRVHVRPSAPWKHARVLAIQSRRTADPGFCQYLFGLNADSGAVSGAHVHVQWDDFTKDDIRDLRDFPRTEEWTEIGLSIREIGGTVTVSASVGGREAIDPFREPQCALGGRLQVNVGFHCDGGDAELRVDDVRLDLR